MQRGFAGLLVVITILVIGIVVGGTLYLNRTMTFNTYQAKSLTATEPLSSSTTTDYQQTQIAPLAVLKPDASWKTYKSSQFRFSIKYPSDWVYELEPRGEEPPIFRPADQTKDQYGTQISFGASQSIGPPEIKDPKEGIILLKVYTSNPAGTKRLLAV